MRAAYNEYCALIWLANSYAPVSARAYFICFAPTIRKSKICGLPIDVVNQMVQYKTLSHVTRYDVT